MATATWAGGSVWGGAGDNSVWSGGSGTSGAPAAGDDVDLALSGPNTLTLGLGTPTLNSFTMSVSTDVFVLPGVLALSVGAGGVTITAGTLSLQGGRIFDGGTLTLGSGAVVSGYGLISAASISDAAAAITETGGKLEISGAIAGASSTLSVGASSSDSILLDSKGSTLASVAFASASGAATLEIGASGALTLTNALAIGANTLKLDAASNAAQLTDSLGLTLQGGQITGTGGIATATTLQGYGNVGIALTSDLNGHGAVTASGGTLDLLGAVTGARTLAIDSTKASVLEINAAASSAAISITNANQTLEIGGSLTLTTAEAVYGGQIKLIGGTLTDSNGLTLGSGATAGNLIGAGTIVAAIGPGASTSVACGITASGGVLTINGAISVGAAPLNLTIGKGPSDALALDVASSATSLTFWGSTNWLDIASAAALTLTNQAAIGANNVALTNLYDATQLTDAGGLTIAGGLIQGGGTIASATSLQGYGSVSIELDAGTGVITASGGTLVLNGLVNNGAASGLRTLAIGTSAGSDLEVGLTSTATATAIAINNANQTLEVAGTLTLTSAQSVTNGIVKLDAGSLADAKGLTFGPGSTLEGSGTVTAAIASSSLINANVSGGTTLSADALTLTGALSGASGLEIGSAVGTTAAKLLLDGVDSAGAVIFNGAGELEIGTSGSLTVSSSLAIGANTVLLGGSGYQLTDSAKVISLAGGSIQGTGTVDQLSAITGYGTITTGLTYALTGGTITAQGGGSGASTLDLGGSVSGHSLVVASTVASDLKVDGTATAAAIVLNSSNQTLEIGTKGSLTLTGAQSLTSALIQIDGGTLTDTSGLTIGAGATLAGSGLVNYSTAISGSGTIAANSGGTLRVGGTLSGTLAMTIGAGSTLQLINLGTATAQTSISFGASTGTLDLSYELSGLDQFYSTVSGFAGANGSLSNSDAIDVTSSTGTDHLVWTQKGAFGTLQVENSSNSALQTLTLTGTYYENQFVLTEASSVDQITYNSSLPCYVAGTRIATERGEVAVEDLAVGENVVTASGALRPIVWIGHRGIDLRRHPAPEQVWPVRVAAHAFGEGLPRRDLWLSPEHAVFVEGRLIPIGRLVNGATIAQRRVDRIEYWHVELESHDVLLAEGLPAESYLDCGNRRQFGNSGVVELHPQWRALADARNFASPRLVERWRAALAQRAVELGYGAELETYEAENAARARVTRTNFVHNPRAEGCVSGRIGAGGEAPRRWRLEAPEGVAIEISGAGEDDGLPFVDIRFSGTPAASGECRVYPEPGAAIAARPGQDWTVSCHLCLIAGALGGVAGVNLYIDEMSADGAYLTGASYAQTRLCGDDLALQRASATRRLERLDAAAMTAYLQLPVAAETALDLTLRIAGMQIEAGRYASALILPPVGKPGIAVRRDPKEAAEAFWTVRAA